MRIGQAAAAAHASRYGTVYVPGNVVDLLYVAPGNKQLYNVSNPCHCHCI